MAKKSTPDIVGTLKSCCPDDCHGAVDDLLRAGFDPSFILGLIIQYGPQLASIVQQLIDLFKKSPKEAAPGCFDGCAEEFRKQHDLLLNALCLNVCLARTHCDKE